MKQHFSLSNNDKISLMSNLSTMLSAGIPIMETVDSLIEDAKGNQKKVLERLRDDLTQGKRVYESLANFPNIFDKVTVNIVKASEEAGTLDITLKDIKDNIRKEAEFSDKVRSAFFYPVIVFCVFLGVMLLMLTFVIPRISAVFLRMKVELPLPTKILIALSNALLHHTIVFVIVTVLIIAALIFAYKSQRRALLQLFTSLPVINTLSKNIDLARFSHSMFLLLSAGIPINSALELCEDVVMKKDIGKAIQRSRELIVGGKKLSEGFKDAKGVFPSILIKITEAGEKTGSLDKSMQEIADHMEYQVTASLKTMTALLEPLMLVVVGVLIGGMMVAILMPIYGLISSVAPH